MSDDPGQKPSPHGRAAPVRQLIPEDAALLEEGPQFECPTCGRGGVRLRVKVTLDLPVEKHLAISKETVRGKDVIIDIIDWASMTMHCLCGWSERRIPPDGGLKKVAAAVVGLKPKAKKGHSHGPIIPGVVTKSVAPAKNDPLVRPPRSAKKKKQPDVDR